MKTQTQIADELGISRMTVRNRADGLELEKRYGGENEHSQNRVFTRSEFELIKNYTGDKRGRKRKG